MNDSARRLIDRLVVFLCQSVFLVGFVKFLGAFASFLNYYGKKPLAFFTLQKFNPAANSALFHILISLTILGLVVLKIRKKQYILRFGLSEILGAACFLVYFAGYSLQMAFPETVLFWSVARFVSVAVAVLFIVSSFLTLSLPVLLYICLFPISVTLKLPSPFVLPIAFLLFLNLVFAFQHLEWLKAIALLFTLGLCVIGIYRFPSVPSFRCRSPGWLYTADMDRLYKYRKGTRFFVVRRQGERKFVWTLLWQGYYLR